jgi:hypothetical protein
MMQHHVFFGIEFSYFVLRKNIQTIDLKYLTIMSSEKYHQIKISPQPGRGS